MATLDSNALQYESKDLLRPTLEDIKSGKNLNKLEN